MQAAYLQIKHNKYNVIILLIMSVLLASCGSSPRIARGPEQIKQIDLDSIPNAVPRHEAFTKYGNPDSYEVFGRRYYTKKSNHGFIEQGIASWYGPKFHGKRTSSGEDYDMYKMTAAHKSIRLPAYVEVTNLRNGKQIIVRVNDRGPFVDNRIIDLSYVAAAKLDLIKQGTGLVEIRVIDPANPFAHRQPNPQQAPVVAKREPVLPQRSETDVVRTQNAPSTSPPVQESVQAQPNPVLAVREKQMYLQLGAFSDQQNAQRLKQRVQAVVNRQITVVSEPSNGRDLFKVRIGPVQSVEVADSIVQRLNNAGLYDHRVVFQ